MDRHCSPQNKPIILHDTELLSGSGGDTSDGARVGGGEDQADWRVELVLHQHSMGNLGTLDQASACVCVLEREGWLGPVFQESTAV